MPRGIPNRKAAADEPPGADAAPESPVDEPVEALAEDAPSAADPDPDPAPEPLAPPDPVAPVDEPQPCSECFPDGWPAGATSVGCVHGQWDRATAGD